MKNYGKVIEYNGVYGSIMGIDGIEYKLLDKNIIDKNIKLSDIVEFEKDFFKTPETEVYIARFVKILKKENNIL